MGVKRKVEVAVRSHGSYMRACQASACKLISSLGLVAWPQTGGQPPGQLHVVAVVVCFHSPPIGGFSLLSPSMHMRGSSTLGTGGQDHDRSLGDPVERVERGGA
jgi:hypothetical protein